MAATKQIAKIQLRRGPQQDLPGEPSIGNPLRPTPALDVAEPIFTTDTGRMFIGRDPQQGGPTVGRTSFPYENIEILTENSSERLQAIFDSHFIITETGYLLSTIERCDPANPNDWRNVNVTIDNNTFALALSAGGNVGFAQVTYFLFSANATPVRTGRMLVLNPASPQAPALIDDCLALPRTDLSGPSASNPQALYASTQFRALPFTSPSGSGVVLQYRNLDATAQSLRLRVERPLP